MSEIITYHSRLRMLERIGYIISLDEVQNIFNDKNLSPLIQFKGGLREWSKHKMEKYSVSCI